MAWAYLNLSKSSIEIPQYAYTYNLNYKHMSSKQDKIIIKFY